MADNIDITPGSGKTVAADDVSSVFYQKMKLDAGGDGVSVPIIAGQQTASVSVPVVVASDQSSVPTKAGVTTAATASWTSGTSVNTRCSMACAGMATAVVRLTGASLVGAAVSFQGSDDGGTTWHAIVGIRESVAPTFAAGGPSASFTYQNIVGTTIGSATWEFRCDVGGFDTFAVILTAAVTSGTLDVRITGSAAPSVVRAIISPDYSGGEQLPVVFNTAQPVKASGDQVAGVTDGGFPVKIGGLANSTPPTAVTDGQRVNAWYDLNGRLHTAVDGSVAHDTADSGNPVKVGARARSTLNGATLVSDDDRTDLIGDQDGGLVVRPFVPLGDIVTFRGTDTGGTSTNVSSGFTAVAGKRNYVTTIVLYNDSSTNGFVDFRDGSGGSVIFTLPLPAKGGVTINFPIPLRQPTANTALAYDVSAALTTVYISLVGFQSKL